MEKEKMTVHRALSELKTIGDRIEKARNSLRPIGIRRGEDLVNGLYKYEDFIKTAESTLQQVEDLIERRIKIKKAIVASNAVTKVKVGDTEMTVSDAITAKSTMEFASSLVDSLKSHWNSAVGKLNVENEKTNVQLQSLLEKMLGNADAVKKAEQSAIDAIQKPFLERNTVKLVDPLGLEKIISEYEEEIATFETNIDAALSETNAVTFIEI